MGALPLPLGHLSGFQFPLLALPALWGAGEVTCSRA